MSDLTRLNVNLNQETTDALKFHAKQRGISYTEAIRQAIAVYSFVLTEQQIGNTVQVLDQNGKPDRNLVIL